MTNERCNYKDAIDVFTFIKCRLRFQFDKFLKRMFFQGNYSHWTALQLNELFHIEQLTIDIEYEAFDTMPVVEINLPCLKIFHYRCGYDTVLRLNAPKLEIFRCESKPTQMYVDHPQSIKNVHLDYYSQSAASFNSVEYLTVDGGYENIVGNRLPHPKITHFVCNDKFTRRYGGGSDVVNAIRELIPEKKHQTKIYYQSVKIEHVDKIKEYDPDNHLAFQIKNYDLLHDNVFCHEILYNEFMDMVNGELPNGFYKKYFNVRSIKVTGTVKDSDHFMGFLKRFEYLNNLTLHNSIFDQKFYDFLPQIDQLTSLDLQNTSEQSKPMTSYDFLSKLTLLQTFCTDGDSIEFFDLTVTLYRQLKYLLVVSFYYEKSRIWISKHEGNSYSLLRNLHQEQNVTYAPILHKDISDLSVFVKWFTGRQ